MSTSAGVISFLIEPGKRFELAAAADISIGQASLHETLVDQNRSSLKIHYTSLEESDEDDDEDQTSKDVKDDETKASVIANFIPGAIEQQLLRFIIPSGQKVVFEITGQNSVYLSGNIILQPPTDLPPYDDSEDDDDGMDDSEIEAMDDEERNAFLEDLVREDKTLEKKKIAIEAALREAAYKSKKRPIDEEDLGTSIVTAATATKKIKGADGTPKVATSPVVAGAAGTAAKKGEDPVKTTPAKKEGGSAKKDTSVKTAPPQKEKKTQESDKKDSPKAKEKKDKPQTDKKETKSFVTRGGVKVEDKIIGNGPVAKAGKTLSMRYILRSSTGKIWDQNVKGKPFKFDLGAGEVIKGWDEGLDGMHVGGERKLEVPPEMGYGKRKSGDIPPNSTLHFEVKLLAIK